MKNGKAILLSAAIILVGGGIIGGNHMLASGAFAVGDALEQAIVMPENIPASALQLTDVGMYSDSNGVVYIASENHNGDVEKQDEPPATLNIDSPEAYQNPTDWNLSGEEAKQMGINAIAKKYGLHQADIDASDVQVRGRYASLDKADVFVWWVQLICGNPDDYPDVDCYHVTINDETAEIVKISTMPDKKEETPLENEISFDKANDIGVAALVKKYALTQETLDRFTVTLRYTTTSPDMPSKHVWWINLYPTNNDDFSEIGCYWSYLDAEAGEILQLNSAANGKG